MNLIIGLAAVDQVTGGKQTKQLADGWMGRESRSGRWLRTLGARALLALAARLAPTADAIPTGQIIASDSPR